MDDLPASLMFAAGHFVPQPSSLKQAVEKDDVEPAALLSVIGIQQLLCYWICGRLLSLTEQINCHE
jgi:hypothetical protein